MLSLHFPNLRLFHFLLGLLLGTLGRKPFDLEILLALARDRLKFVELRVLGEVDALRGRRDHVHVGLLLHVLADQRTAFVL